ncbi:MAG: hypothetical protein IT581_06400 [Verrucomicrobiales bacterium]|nr:hypothetical protein [Verrucomicrobiales bacterium]
MATPITELYEFVRVTIGDSTPGAYQFEDDHIRTAVLMVVRGGKIKGFGLSQNLQDIEPSLEDPNAFLLAVYEASIVLVRPQTERHAYRTRALSESFGGQQTLFAHLLAEVDTIEKLRSGSFFQSWGDLRSYCIGNYGSSVWDRLVSVEVSGRAWTVSISGDGIRSA